MFSGFSVAIPMDCISSFSIYGEKTESNNRYISLPLLFNLPQEIIRHCIILKNGNNSKELSDNQTILLTTEVNCETEIPNEEIYPLPKTLCRFRFYSLFSGIQFNSRLNQGRGLQDNLNNAAGKPVLLLNPEQFVQNSL